MITHCPSCHTHFRVHAEQPARAGQVRCGKCSRVFDALEHLIEEIARLARLDHPGFDALASILPRQYASPLLRKRKNSRGSAEAVIAETLTPGQNRQNPKRRKRQNGPRSNRRTSIQKRRPAQALDFGPTVTAESAKPGRRWPWLVGALLLLLMLLAQAAYQYRSAIVLLFPETKPYAAALCANLGCDLPLPRRIELVSIEASDLQADTTNPSVMVLSATLKNRAIFNQQHPSLELTCFNTQEQPLVRRVLAPQDYFGRAVSTQAGFVSTTKIAILVFIA